MPSVSEVGESGANYASYLTTISSEFAFVNFRIRMAHGSEPVPLFGERGIFRRAADGFLAILLAVFAARPAWIFVDVFGGVLGAVLQVVLRIVVGKVLAGDLGVI
jgi:hypothetical protein